MPTEKTPHGLPFDPVVQLFPGYMIPRGYLTTARETHALFYYYLCARQKYENEEGDHPLPVLEGHDDPDPSLAQYRQLFKSIARMYGVTPEAMAKAWDVVDKQCVKLRLPLMPDGEKYRHNGVPELVIKSGWDN